MPSMQTVHTPHVIPLLMLPTGWSSGCVGCCGLVWWVSYPNLCESSLRAGIEAGVQTCLSVGRSPLWALFLVCLSVGRVFWARGTREIGCCVCNSSPSSQAMDRRGSSIISQSPVTSCPPKFVSPCANTTRQHRQASSTTLVDARDQTDRLAPESRRPPCDPTTSPVLD